MAIDTTPPRFDYVGNGTVATYDFPNLKISAGTDLRVTVKNTAGVETQLVFGVDFTVSGLNLTTGGSITLTAGNLTSGYLLTIRYDKTPQQTTDFRNQGGVFLEVIEDKFDEVVRFVQSLRDTVQRSMHLPETEVGTALATVTPTLALRASKFAYWDSAGNLTGVVVVSPGTLTVSAFIETLLDDANAGAARATLGVSAFIDTLLNDADAATARGTLGAAGVTAIETLTNKTLTAPILTSPTVSSGPLTMTSGKIAFPAIQIPSAGANDLDDYEEGTWTPSLGGNTTYIAQEGTYTKIGNFVFIRGRISVNVLGTGAVNNVTGIPFTAAVGRYPLAVSFTAGLATAVVSITGQVQSTLINFYFRTAASTSDTAGTVFGNATEISFAGGYFI